MQDTSCPWLTLRENSGTEESSPFISYHWGRLTFSFLEKSTTPLEFVSWLKRHYHYYCQSLNWLAVLCMRLDWFFFKEHLRHTRTTSCATFLLLPHFDIICDICDICDLLLIRHTSTQNLFVKWLTVKQPPLLSATSPLYPIVAIVEMVQKGYEKNLGGGRATSKMKVDLAIKMKR